MALVQLIIAIIFGIIASVIAANKHRNALGWFIIGFFLNLVGVIIITLLKDPIIEENYKNRMEQENRRLREQLHQERIKNESFRKYATTRLDEHDEHLGIDTKHVDRAYLEPTHSRIRNINENEEQEDDHII